MGSEAVKRYMYRRTPVLFAALPTTGRYTKTCSANYFGKVGLTGFEPATSWSRTKRSTKLSYSPFVLHILFS